MDQDHNREEAREPQEQEGAQHPLPPPPRIWRRPWYSSAATPSPGPRYRRPAVPTRSSRQSGKQGQGRCAGYQPGGPGPAVVGQAGHRQQAGAACSGRRPADRRGYRCSTSAKTAARSISTRATTTPRTPRSSTPTTRPRTARASGEAGSDAGAVAIDLSETEANTLHASLVPLLQDYVRARCLRDDRAEAQRLVDVYAEVFLGPVPLKRGIWQQRDLPWLARTAE